LTPLVACFEYDQPGPEQLQTLEVTRIGYPHLPVLMITVEHSEALAVWALRVRVWDYLVMPVRTQDLCSRLAMLSASAGAPGVDRLPAASPPAGGTNVTCTAVADNSGSPGRVLPALSFLETNYSEKVTLRRAAQLCGLGPYQFSRAFKHEQGTTFREFLIIHRLSRAIRMLEHSDASVTEVAFSVGFNDLSYFARMFRRYLGVCPSDYRRDKENRPAVLPLPHIRQPEWPVAKYSYPAATKS
jgi:AraC-like DNA-binding protein